MSDYIRVVYNEDKRPYTDYPLKLCRYLFETFGLSAGMKFLEAGCGRGEHLRHFKNMGMEATGIDADGGASSYNPELDIRICDVEKNGLPFPDDSFDAVYSKSFIEHLRNPDKYVAESYRVLKRGGLFLTLVPDWEANYKIYFDDHTHRTPFTRPSLEDIYGMNGFSNVKVVKFRQLPIVWKYPAINYLCAAISPFVPVRTKNKFLKWSRELMLIGCGTKM